jgi:hypothetical protein
LDIVKTKKHGYAETIGIRLYRNAGKYGKRAPVPEKEPWF